MFKSLRFLIAAAVALAFVAAPVAAQQVLTNPTIIDHLKSAPANAAPTLSSCGTGPSIAAGSSDMTGRVVTGSGATTCTISFARTYGTGTVPVCTVSAEVATQPTYTYSATGITFSVSIASTAYNYHCIAIGSAT